MSGPHATGLHKAVIDALADAFPVNYMYAEPPANDDVLIEGFAHAIAQVAIDAISKHERDSARIVALEEFTREGQKLGTVHESPDARGGEDADI